MKFLQTILCLTLLLEIFTIVLTDPAEEGLPLNYECANEENNDEAPVVVLHGFLSFIGMYLDLRDDLALNTTRKVCVVDLRNHGDSPWSDALDIETMTSDIYLLVKTLGVEKIILLGHSLGGKLAVHFALTYPEKIEKLIIEDMRPNGMDADFAKTFGGNLDGQRNLLKMIPEGATEEEAKQVLAGVYTTLFKNVDPSLEYPQKAVEKIPIKCEDGVCSWKTNLDVLDKLQADPLAYCSQSSGKCEAPTLFMYGLQSPLKVAVVEDEIMTLFPNAKLIGIKGGHIIHCFSEFTEEVINFINSDE